MNMPLKHQRIGVVVIGLFYYLSWAAALYGRADPGVVYTVVEETGGVFAIRAIK